MITVKFIGPKPENIAKQIVESVIDRLSEELSQYTCPVHGEHPTLEVTGTNVRAVSCCDELDKLIPETL